MGARSKSSTSSEITTNNINLADNSGIALANATGNTITTTDHGAIDAAFGFGNEALETVSGTVSGAFATTERALEQTNNTMLQSAKLNADQLAAVTDLAKTVQTSGSVERNEAMVKIVAIGGLVLLALVLLSLRGNRRG